MLQKVMYVLACSYRLAMSAQEACQECHDASQVRCCTNPVLHGSPCSASTAELHPCYLRHTALMRANLPSCSRHAPAGATRWALHQAAEPTELPQLGLTARLHGCRAQLARAQGDFLLVGLHADEAVAERRGAHLPIMDLHERSLSVLACRYVNEVIIGARAVPLTASVPSRPGGERL